MKSLYPLKGIVTVLNTPFTISGKVDIKSLKTHISEALEAGVSGFLVPAMASEIYKITVNERLAMVEATLSVTNGRVPVFAGLGEKNLNPSRKLLKSYLKIGCKNILLQIPFKNQNQFKSHFMKLAEIQPDVIMLQDWDASGYGLPDELITDLFLQVETFRCLKIEIIPAGIKYSRILELTDHRLNISGGWAVTQMIEGLQRGVHAFMPTGMHYIYTQIYRDFISGKKQEAKQLFNDILPVLAFANQHIDISIHFFKQLLKRKNIYKTDLIRQPSLPFDNLHKEIAEEHINHIIQLEEKIRKKRIIDINSIKTQTT